MRSPRFSSRRNTDPDYEKESVWDTGLDEDDTNGELESKPLITPIKQNRLERIAGLLHFARDSKAAGEIKAESAQNPIGESDSPVKIEAPRQHGEGSV